MITLIKLLKIVLPVATVTTATIFTTSLISFSKKESEKDSENKDKILDDLELKAKEFEEQTMLYSEDGTGESVTLNDDMKEEVMKLLKEKGNLDNLPGLGQGSSDFEKLKKILDSLKNNSPENNTDPKDNQKGEQILDNKSENSQVQAVKQAQNQPLEGVENSEEIEGSKDTAAEGGDKKQGKSRNSSEEKDSSIAKVDSETSSVDMGSKLNSEKSNASGDQRDTEPTSKKGDDSASDSRNTIDERQSKGGNIDQDTGQNENTERNLNSTQESPDIREPQQSSGQQPNLEMQSSSVVEDSSRNDSENVLRGEGESTSGSTNGKPKLSEKEMQKWEELLNEISNMSNRLQVIST